MHRLHIQVAGADEHQIGLLARGERANAIELAEHTGTLDRDPAQRFARCERRGGRYRAVRLPVRHVVKRALHAQRNARLRQHVAAEHALQVCPERGRSAKLAQAARQRMAVALCHLVFGSRRKAHAQVAKTLQLRVIECMAVHDVDLRAQQPLLLQAQPAIGRAGRPTALMQ